MWLFGKFNPRIRELREATSTFLFRISFTRFQNLKILPTKHAQQRQQLCYILVLTLYPDMSYIILLHSTTGNSLFIHLENDLIIKR